MSSQAARDERSSDWLSDRVVELRRDQELRRKITRIRDGIADGTFVGDTHTSDDLERLANEP